MRFAILLLCYSCIQQESSSLITYSSPELTIKELSEGVYLHTSFLKTENWGNVACNGMIYLNDKECVIFDSPSSSQATKELLSILKKENITCKAVIATHFHIDCLGTLDQFHEANIPSISTKQTQNLATKTNHTIPKITFDTDTSLYIGKQEVIAKYFGEGHTVDNIIGYIPDHKALFGGCLIKALGAGKGNLNDANVEEWATTVKHVKEEYPNVSIVIPGHGDYGGSELLDFTIDLFSSK